MILLHFQLPFVPGPIYGAHPEDPGCSVILFFELKELKCNLSELPFIYLKEFFRSPSWNHQPSASCGVSLRLNIQKLKALQ